MYRYGLTLLAVTLAGAGQASAQTGSRSYPLHGFDRVSASGCDTVVITAGAGFGVAARGDPAALDALRLSVSNGTLHVDRAPHSCDSRGGGRPRATVSVTMPGLRGVEESGTGGITIDRVGGSAFEASLSGTGDITLVDLASDRARLDVSGTGSIHAAGHTRTLDIDLSGTGHIDTRRVEASAVTAEVGGTGSLVARADATARIEASGTGSITIDGHPRCEVHKSGTGSVHCG